MIRIQSVSPFSPAEKAGIHAGESLISINGETVIDEIDYQDLILHPHLEIEIADNDGNIRQISIAKSSWEPLGLQLDETIAMKPRHCMNHCVFCFIDQMPPGMRETLYVKDDDWRLSLMMGNYVTLTNVDDQEFIRILRRKASPLYISVHATDPEVRVKMLRNPNAGKIVERLSALKNHGLQFHSQIVLCPGFNDGDVLEKTLDDLASLWPSSLSVAIVPIGMTKYRSKLTQIPPVSRDLAEKTIQSVSRRQQKYLEQFGTRFVFLSDEFYCIAGLEIPEEEHYEDYPQIENGVGMIRQFEDECESAFQDFRNVKRNPEQNGVKTRLAIPTGVSVFPYIRKLVRLYSPEWIQAEVVPVPNRFFGDSITVTGLIVGQDLINVLKGKEFDKVLISESMLRENTNCFLDDYTLEKVQDAIGKPIQVVRNTGESFISALFQTEEAI